MKSEKCASEKLSKFYVAVWNDKFHFIANLTFQKIIRIETKNIVSIEIFLSTKIIHSIRSEWFLQDKKIIIISIVTGKNHFLILSDLDLTVRCSWSI